MPKPRIFHRLSLLTTLLVFLAFLSLSVALMGGIFTSGPNNHATAATSSTINFQARLLTNTGALVPDGNYHVEFKLYNTSTSSGSSQGSCSGDASCVWTETRTTGNLVRVVNGYLTVNLGSVTPFGSSIDWDQEHWLTMNIGGAGGSPSWDGEMTPRLKLTATPYAMTAGKLVQNAGSGNKTTLDFAAPSGNNSILLPAESGTVCLTSGNCAGIGGTGDILQGGNSFGGAMTIGTNDDYGLNLEVNNTTVVGFSNTGQATFKNSANSTTAFQIQKADSTSLFTVDTTNSTITTTDLRPTEVGIITSGIVTNDIPGSDNWPLPNRNATWSGVGSDGFVRTVYVYYDEDLDTNILEFVRCTDIDCTSPVITTVAQGDINDNNITMALDNDLAHIGYAEYDSGIGGEAYKYISCTNADCTTNTVETIYAAEDEQEINYSSVAIGADGFARFVISIYYDASDQYGSVFIRCTNADCTTTGTINNLAFEEESITNTNIAIGPDGYPYISYVYNDNTINFIHCISDNCAAESPLAAYDLSNLGDGRHDFTIDEDGKIRLAFVRQGDNGGAATIRMLSCSMDGGFCYGGSTDILKLPFGYDNAALSVTLDSNNSPLVSAQIGGLVGTIICGNDDYYCENNRVSWVQDNINDESGIDTVLGPDGLLRLLYIGWGDYDEIEDEELPSKLVLARFTNPSGSSTATGTSIGSESNPFGSIYSIQMAASMLYLEGDGTIFSVADSSGYQTFSIDTTVNQVKVNGDVDINGDLTADSGYLRTLSVSEDVNIGGGVDIAGNLNTYGNDFNIGDGIVFGNKYFDGGNYGVHVSIADVLQARYSPYIGNGTGLQIFRDVRIGNSNNDNNGLIFVENFESGNLNLWDNSVGSISVGYNDDLFNSEINTSRYSGLIEVDNSPSEVTKYIGNNPDGISYVSLVRINEHNSGDLILTSFYNDNGDRFSVYREFSSGRICIYNGITDSDSCGDSGAMPLGQPIEIWFYLTESYLEACWTSWNDEDCANDESDGIGIEPITQIGIGDSVGSGVDGLFLVDNIQVTNADSNDATGSLSVANGLFVGGSSILQNQLLVQNTAGAALFYVDGYNSRITIGEDTLFTLGGFDSEPTGTNGSMYYDTVANKFRCYENGAWVDCIGSSGGGGDILQDGNSFGADMTIGTNDEYDLNFETDGVTRVTIDTDGNTTFNGHVLPGTNDTYDLGSDSARWRDLYTGPGTVHVGTSTTDEGTISYNTSTNNLTIGATNGVLVQNSADSTTAFQVQNASGSSLLTANTSNMEMTINGSVNIGRSNIFSDNFETNSLGLWDDNNGMDTAGTAYNSNYAARVSISGGTEYAETTIPDSRVVHLQAYVYVDDHSGGSIDLIFTGNGSNSVSLYRNNGSGLLCVWDGGPNCSGTSLPLDQWHRVELYVAIHPTDSSKSVVRLFYDGVQILVLNSVNVGSDDFDLIGMGQGASGRTATYYIDNVIANGESSSGTPFLDLDGSLRVNGDSSFYNSALFQSQGGSTTAFQIQDAAGTSNLFIADTTNNRIGIGAAPANSLLTIGTNTTTASGGITFGTDTNLYRSASNTLKTDDSLVVQGTLSVVGDVLLDSASEIIWGGDTNLYRMGANNLATDDYFYIQRASSSTEALGMGAVGDAYSRLYITAGGTMSWGSGAAPEDTHLFRSAAGILQTEAPGSDTTIRINVDDTYLASLQLWETNDRGFNLIYDADVGNFVLQTEFTGSNEDVMTVSRSNGSVIFRNSGNSTAGFQVQQSDGSAVLLVDTTNASVTFQDASGGEIVQISNATGLQVKTSQTNAWTNLGTDGSIDILRLYTSGGSTVLSVSASGNTQFTVPADAFEVRSGASGTRSSLQIGRTSDDVTLGVTGAAGQYSGDTDAAGDVVLRTESATAKLILQNGTGDGNIILDNGNTIIKPTTNSTTAFRVQNAAGSSSLFNIDTSTTSGSRNGIIQIGTGSGTSATLLVLDIKTNSGDPTGQNGAMYYNSNSNKFRCYQNSGWTDCIAAGGGDILQNGNSFGGAMTIGTNDNNALNFETNGTTRGTLTTAGQLQLSVTGTGGGILIGGDAQLYRSNTNEFSTASGDALVVNGALTAAGGNLSVTGSGNFIFNSSGNVQVQGSNVNVTRASAGNNAYLSWVTSDTNPRYQVNADGTIQWGPGNAALDTNLYRSAANTLKTDDSFIVQPASNNTSAFLVSNSTGTNNVLQVDTSNSRVAIGLGTTAPAQRLTVNAGANYGWNDYIGLTDGTRTGYLGLSNSAGSMGFRTGETGNTSSDYIFFGSGGSTQVATLDEGAGLNISVGNSATQGLKVQRQNGQEFLSAWTDGTFSTLTLGNGFTQSELLFTDSSNASWSFYTDASELKLYDYVNGLNRMVFSPSGNIQIGQSDTAGSLLILDTKTNSGDPSGTNGAMYYNSNTNTFRCYENSVWKDCLSRHVIELGSDVSDSTGATCSSYVDITGLSFAVTSGRSYRFNATIGYTSSSNGNGSNWSVNGPSNSFLAYTSRWARATTNSYGVINSPNYNQVESGQCDTSSTAGNMFASIEGVITPSANGTVTMRMASEAASGGTITAKAGSTLEWW